MDFKITDYCFWLKKWFTCHQFQQMLWRSSTCLGMIILSLGGVQWPWKQHYSCLLRWVEVFSMFVFVLFFKYFVLFNKEKNGAITFNVHHLKMGSPSCNMKRITISIFFFKRGEEGQKWLLCKHLNLSIVTCLC